jgi:hypothetical protein
VSAQAHTRLEFLLGAENTAWNGIDYVEIASSDQTQLRVHFLTTVTVAPTTPPPLVVTITGGETIPSVAVLPIDPTTAWSLDTDGRPVFSLSVAALGDFSNYTLTISGATALDPYFDSVAFSFKANCPSDFDCAEPSTSCDPEPSATVTVNYLAKDFAGFTQALSDFSALRYPNWMERSEADFGVMMLEALSAIADELSYYQDRVAGEATIDIATQRVSLVRHARLVDYEPSPAAAATTILQLEVASATPVPAGLQCSALGADGNQIPFAVGEGLTGGAGSATFAVDPRWNSGSSGAPNLEPYWWDQSRQCLPPGSTTVWLLGTGHGLQPGQQLLIDTAGPTSADAPIRELITIAAGTVGAPSVVETEDPVFASGESSTTPLTKLTLAAPTTLKHDLALTRFAGNLVPAAQGEIVSETFAIPSFPSTPPAPGANLPTPAVVRTGANWTPSQQVPTYLYTLTNDTVSWLPALGADADTTVSGDLAPQVVLTSSNPTETEAVDVTGSGVETWEWQRWLLDSSPEAATFTLTPERYSLVGTGGSASPGGAGTSWYDYDGEGVTIKFGDGRLGVLPTPGTVFTATYLSGGGTVGNVPADSIIRIESLGGSGIGPAPEVTACTNPFPATGGTDEETTQQIRDRAPQAFRASPLRAVLTSDYVSAAQSEAWVQQAGTTFRWTGSWVTLFTTADPAGAEQPTIDQLAGLSDLLNRRRLAGYESYVLPPQYASIDLEVTVAANSVDFSSDVAAAVRAQLQPGTLVNGETGFFHHSRWGFGQPLAASALLAAIQTATGVAGVLLVQYRQRGLQPDWTPLPETLTPPANRILRLDNDPSQPEAGSLRVIVEGGK